MWLCLSFLAKNPLPGALPEHGEGSINPCSCPLLSPMTDLLSQGFGVRELAEPIPSAGKEEPSRDSLQAEHSIRGPSTQNKTASAFWKRLPNRVGEQGGINFNHQPRGFGSDQGLWHRANGQGQSDTPRDRNSLQGETHSHITGSHSSSVLSWNIVP